MNYDHVGMTDGVRGIVIGGDDGTVYKFYTTVPPGVEHYLGGGLFSSDTEAETYCKAEWPDAYARGIEMRAFDQSPRPTTAPG